MIQRARSRTLLWQCCNRCIERGLRCQNLEPALRKLEHSQAEHHGGGSQEDPEEASSGEWQIKRHCLHVSRDLSQNGFTLGFDFSQKLITESCETMR